MTLKKNSLSLHIEEVSGDKYPDLKAAQRLALPAIVSALEAVFHDLLEQGVLVVQNGRIIPKLQTRPVTISGPYHVISTNYPSYISYG